jgi:hypothetical protein
MSTEEITRLIDFALEFGAQAHHDIAMVVHKMFENAWSYIPRRGWRVLEDGRCYSDEGAIIKIKELLSSVVHLAFLERARHWRTESELLSEIKCSSASAGHNAEKAREIAAQLLNATYKTHIIEECMIFFLCI